MFPALLPGAPVCAAVLLSGCCPRAQVGCSLLCVWQQCTGGMAGPGRMHTSAPLSWHLSRRVSSNLHKENLPKGKEELIRTPYLAPQADWSPCSSKVVFWWMKWVMHKPHGRAWQQRPIHSQCCSIEKGSSSSPLGSYKVQGIQVEKDLVFLFLTPHTVIEHLLYVTPLLKVWILRMWRRRACKSFFITEIQKLNGFECELNWGQNWNHGVTWGMGGTQAVGRTFNKEGEVMQVILASDISLWKTKVL